MRDFPTSFYSYLGGIVVGQPWTASEAGPSRCYCSGDVVGSLCSMGVQVGQDSMKNKELTRESKK